MAALMGRQDDCSCADSRHIKDVDEFQGIRLMSSGVSKDGPLQLRPLNKCLEQSTHFLSFPDSTAADARPCELSNVIYRSITIHGLRDPELHHEVMRYGLTNFVDVGHEPSLLMLGHAALQSCYIAKKPVREEFLAHGSRRGGV